MPAISDENIRGLDVTVNNSLRVCRVQGVCDFNSQFEKFVERQWLAGNALPKGLAVEKLHRNELPAVLLADVVNGADVRVIQRRCRLPFSPETLESGKILGHLRREEFQADGAMEPRVLSLVNDTHAAATKLFDDAVV